MRAFAGFDITYTAEILEGYTTISHTYHIGATYCVPHTGSGSQPDPGTVQLLSHGIGFDRSYWDFPYENGTYSCVHRALAAGYATLAWDRLGIGASSHGDPLSEVQTPLETAALIEITRLLRHEHGPFKGYRKVVHVGHSFGSIMSYGLGVIAPELSDGLVLTGFTQVPNFIPYFALGADFVSAEGGHCEKGYLPPNSIQGLQQAFFAPGQYEWAVVEEAAKNGQPVSVGEFLTVVGRATDKSAFEGPVLIIMGDRDLVFCGGDCTRTGIKDVGNFMELSKPIFPKAKHLELVSVPGAGHGLNLQTSYDSTYDEITKFLDKNAGWSS